MKTKIAVLLTALGYFWSGASASPNAACRVWNCDNTLGGNAERGDRICANITDAGSTADPCTTDNFFCNVQFDMAVRTNCSSVIPVPWKANMPAGDSCTSNDECFSKSCVERDGGRYCSGSDQNATCTTDMNCREGLYCTTGAARSCQPVIPVGQPCNGTARCTFGSLCANNTCTRMGTLKTGTRYNITDDEVFTTPTADFRVMYWVCENFYALLTDITPDGQTKRLLECTEGPQRDFTEDARVDTNLDCKFYHNRVWGDGKPMNTTEQARCGFNQNDKFYCPSRRGSKQFSSENGADRTTWGTAPATCHHRTTIQYCREIESNIGRSLGFRNFLRTEWRTTGDNWPLVANNNRCVGNAVLQTRAYWRIVDSATGAALSFFGLIAGLFVMAFVY